MKNNSSTFVRLLAACGAALCLAASAGAQTVILDDTFSRSGNLAGTSPDVGGSTWTVNSLTGAWAPSVGTITTDGTAADISSATINTTGTLAFTPSANMIYTLSATVTWTSGSSGWLAFGFADDNYGVYGSTSTSGSTASSWMLVGPTNKVSAFAGPGTAGQITLSPTSPTNTGTLSIQLNTATDVLTLSVNGVQVGTTTYGSLPAIADIFIEAHSAVGTIDNLQLTATAVPEPSAAFLLLGGAGVLALAGRRVRLRRS